MDNGARCEICQPGQMISLHFLQDGKFTHSVAVGQTFLSARTIVKKVVHTVRGFK
jgi:hypothetical protein